MRFVDKHIELDKLPKKFKKMTATRFASVLGLNTWKTPFATWCEMTRTYEEPFTDSIYTIAGKVIEPKIIDYLKERFFLISKRLKTFTVKTILKRLTATFTVMSKYSAACGTLNQTI